MQDIIEQIRIGFETESRLHTAPVLATSLPLSYEDITTEWLTNALCAGVPGARVEAFELAAPDNGTSNRRRIRLRYNAPGQRHGLPTAIFCKATHGLLNRLALGTCGAAYAEQVFYRDIRPLLEIEAPVSFYQNYNTETHNSMIMLNDISDSVTEFCSHKTQITRPRAESQIRLLAKLHGSAYADTKVQSALAGLATWREYFNKTLLFGMREGACQGFIDAGNAIPQALRKRAAEVWPATVKSVEIQNAFAPTLSHGDSHLKNWYVAGNGEMGLSDWQCSARGHWGRDFAYTISTALTVQDRRSWEQDLLRLYLALLAENGGPEVAFHEAWQIYRQQLFGALAWWTVTLSPPGTMPDMQPRDITIEFINRIATAIDDLEALESV
jgi:aminoglycoside phosphotransferase (APT) family kinase protein